MHATTMFFSAVALLASGVAGFAAGHTTSPGVPVPQQGKEHKWLASLAGEYTAKVDGSLGKSDGTSKIESSLGGLWSVRHFESRLMNRPLKGMEIFGFDPVKKKFVSVWVDSMNPFMMTMEGTYDAAKETLTMRGISVAMDGEKAEMVNTTRFNDHGMTFTMNMEGQKGPLMTIEYTRKKQDGKKEK